MTTTIRQAIKEDNAALQNLLATLGYPVGRREIEDRLRLIRDRDGEIFVACRNNDIVGSVSAMVDIRLAGGVSGEIVTLVVDKDHRGRGIGMSLLNHGISWLLDKECPRILIRANVKRTAAHQFYLTNGFSELKTQKIFCMNNLVKK